jgi:hypothetical protein
MGDRPNVGLWLAQKKLSHTSAYPSPCLKLVVRENIQRQSNLYGNVELHPMRSDKMQATWISKLLYLSLYLKQWACMHTVLVKGKKRKCTYNVTLRRVHGAGLCLRACILTCQTFNTHVPYCHLRSLLLHHIFRRYRINATIFEKEKILGIKCTFWFSLQLLFQQYLILKRIQRNIVINFKTSSYKVPVILVVC